MDAWFKSKPINQNYVTDFEWNKMKNCLFTNLSKTLSPPKKICLFHVCFSSAGSSCLKMMPDMKFVWCSVVQLRVSTCLSASWMFCFLLRRVFRHLVGIFTNKNQHHKGHWLKMSKQETTPATKSTWVLMLCSIRAKLFLVVWRHQKSSICGTMRKRAALIIDTFI